MFMLAKEEVCPRVFAHYCIILLGSALPNIVARGERRKALCQQVWRIRREAMQLCGMYQTR